LGIYALVSGVQETCQATSVSYRRGERFYSLKENGARYRCTCNGQDGCTHISCTQTDGPRPATAAPIAEIPSIEASEDDEEIQGQAYRGGGSERVGDSNAIFVPEVRPSQRYVPGISKFCMVMFCLQNLLFSC